MKWETKHLRKSMKPNTGFFENIDKVNKPLVKLIRKKMGKIKITNCNERGEIQILSILKK